MTPGSPDGRLFIGLMSGTSMDGIDAVLTRSTASGLTLEAHHAHPMDAQLRQDLAALSTGERDHLHALATLDHQVAIAFGDAVQGLLEKADCSADSVSALGSHGQTVRHHPAGPTPYTVQIGDPSVIAERTGIPTVADFRRRDMAAGGEGAPLVPPFHAQQFGSAGKRRAIVNIGGIANATLLSGKQVVAGFDCGPGNTLLDAWVQRHLGLSYDAHGAWSAEHTELPVLRERLLAEPYFTRTGPRSTGPELFNLAWLEQHLKGDEDPGAVQATLVELTAAGIDTSLRTEDSPSEVYVCGGGARNTDLMRRLHQRLHARSVYLSTTDELGLDCEWVEACAFAWLAQRTVDGLSGNAPTVTGARGERVLGGVYGQLRGIEA